MIQINLLPWREQSRQIKKTKFFAALISCVCISLFILLICHIHYHHIYSQQNKLNTILSIAINDEQQNMNQMSNQEIETNSIDTQLQLIIKLLKNSYGAVRLLNELIELVPNTILLTQIKLNGHTIILSGEASSEDDITRLLNSISKSPYFNQPTLSSIETIKNNAENARSFKLTFEQKDS